MEKAIGYIMIGLISIAGLGLIIGFSALLAYSFSNVVVGIITFVISASAEYYMLYRDLRK